MQPEAGKEQDFWQEPDEGLGAQSAVSETLKANEPAPLSWEASEAIHHEKHALWFVGLVTVAVLLLAISIFVIKSWTFAALIVTMAAAIVIIGSRPPRVMQYKLTHQGILVNERMFLLRDFRAFGVVQEGVLYSIVLIPHKRFMPGVNVYFPSENGEEIVDLFGSVLPMEHIEPDFIDKLSHKLHF